MGDMVEEESCPDGADDAGEAGHGLGGAEEGALLLVVGALGDEAE